MAHSRSIDPGVWSHPFFRRQPWYVRDVFLYLFSCAADDEGRFHADPLAILEGAFPRSYPVTEDEILQGLQELEEAGLILRYGDEHEWGFLPGWYEHQFLQSTRRQPSDHPAPPCEICSWAVADAIRAAYAKATNRHLQTCGYRSAIAWWTVGTQDEDGALTERMRSVNASSTECQPKGVRGKGVRVENDSRANAGASAPASALKRAKRTPAELAAETETLRTSLPPDLIPSLDLWLDNLASHNKSEALTAGRALSETQGVADLLNVHGLTPAAVRHGITEALSRVDRKDKRPGITSIAFVLEVAKSFDPGDNGSRPPRASPVQPRLSDAERDIAAILQQRDQHGPS